MDNIVLNVVRSPPDTRDWIVESVHHKDLVLPTTLDLRDNLQDVKDQGSAGTCAAQTAACMKEWQEKVQLGLDRQMSPQFVYNNRSNSSSSGMYGRDVMRILQKVGCVLEADYFYGTEESLDKIPPELLEKAKNYCISNYAQVTTVDGLKGSLAINGPCYISFGIYNKTTSMWKPETPGQAQIGGHAMTVVGYNEEGFIIRNSWGSGWGDNGYCIFSYKDWGCQQEVWTTVDASSSQIDNPNRDTDKCLPLRKLIAKLHCGKVHN